MTSSTPFRLDAGRERTHLMRRLGPLQGLARRYQRWNWAWRLEIALRYEPVVAALAARPWADTILDVGCGSKGGLTAYLPRPALGVDVTFDLERVHDHPLLLPLAASGRALPLAAASCDAAVCLDTLEHLEPAGRREIVSEMARVLRPDGLLIVGAPCGEAARDAEERLAQEYRQATGRVHPKLGEHLAHDAWSCHELVELVTQAAGRRFPRYEYRVVPNMNVEIWLFLRRLFDLGRPLPGLTHGQRLLQPLYPMLASRLHTEPAYRQVVFVQGLSA